ncbi:MAG: heme o synthase [Desulfosarcinaceae bacterium]
MNRTGTLKNYILVTKPGVVLGNLVSVAGGFFLASRGYFDTTLLMATLMGVGLVAASGCVFNNCIDRHLDRKMQRTRRRVMAEGRMTPGSAVSYATLLGMAGIILLWETTNLMCVSIVLTGWIVYVGIYTLYLKPRSASSTLIGSLAGAAPPLAGYCAVLDRLDTGALLLAAIFSLWQMPHFYAIAIARLNDYTAAAIPVLPVRQGIRTARKHIIAYILVFTAAVLLPTFTGFTGNSYLAVTGAMGLAWITAACSGWKTGNEQRWARRVFIFSILCITLVSAMMALDSTLLQPAKDLLLTCRP